MIHKYLKELVENNNRIIIPDFGAFMIQNTPDGKQISFNDFLKFNDGLLVNQIIKAEKISKNEATEQVKEFVKQIETAFSSGKSYEVKEIGFLIKDENGNIKFDAKPGKPTTEKPIAETKDAKGTDAKPTIILDERKAATKTEESAPANKEEEKPKVEVPATKPIVAETKPKVTEEKTTPVATKPLAPQVTNTKPPQTKVTTNTQHKVTNTMTPQKKNLALPIIIIVACLVVGGGIWAAIHFGLFAKKSETIVEVVPMEPVIDTTPVVEVDTVIMEEPKVIVEPDVDINKKHYYIVAGSFKVENNAIRFNQRLIEEGYKSEIVERSNGFYTVSYKTIYDWNEALQEWRQMRNTNEQTWILVK